MFGFQHHCLQHCVLILFQLLLPTISTCMTWHWMINHKIPLFAIFLFLFSFAALARFIETYVYQSKHQQKRSEFSVSDRCIVIWKKKMLKWLCFPCCVFFINDNHATTNTWKFTKYDQIMTIQISNFCSLRC